MLSEVFSFKSTNVKHMVALEEMSGYLQSQQNSFMCVCLKYLFRFLTMWVYVKKKPLPVSGANFKVR